jgi:hypothetical protein
MKLIKAFMTAALVAESLGACTKDPVLATVAPQLVMSADNVAVNLFTSAAVSAAIFNTVDALQFVSRDQAVATVNAVGAVTGAAWKSAAFPSADRTAAW